MSIITVGIDLAKNIFAVHGVNENGKAALVKPKVAREKLLALIAQLPPCLIGMEACSGAHHWARLFRTYGHPYRQTDCPAVRHPVPNEWQERCGRCRHQFRQLGMFFASQDDLGGNSHGMFS